jgi:glycosyltransferase 2 family protein
MAPRSRYAGIAALGAGIFALGAQEARRHPVTPLELRCFHAVNGLPAGGFRPVWAVMQVGSLGGVVAVAAGSAVARRQTLGRCLAACGTVTWLAAKVAKQPVRRGRPTGTVELARVLGNEQAGLGYPSGHAAVVAALYCVAEPHLPPRWRGPAMATALGVGAARVYVGAHLPLDVVGGFALGSALGAGSHLLRRPAHPPMSTPRLSRSC